MGSSTSGRVVIRRTGYAFMHQFSMYFVQCNFSRTSSNVFLVPRCPLEASSCSCCKTSPTLLLEATSYSFCLVPLTLSKVRFSKLLAITRESHCVQYDSLVNMKRILPRQVFVSITFSIGAFTMNTIRSRP